ncbi:uncharacterized protein LOC105789516 [Gossypium raimondii]|uniref:uncharacterized protein LOC105789516 n=1 Tax=Gossypium raimondii TaxID=29730 RepID=UPI00063AD675|nr:uncharacterized protein LOC105789516 [Gossypium raimondii]
MAPYEAPYGRKCCTPLCWTELGERRVLDSELVFEIEDKLKLILDHLKAASDRQKSYADLKKRDIEYSMGDYVFLKVFPRKKVLRFRRRDKLSPRFIEPYQILKCVGLVAYHLEQPLELDCIHDVFHIEVRLDLTFEEELVQILDEYVKVVRRKSFPLVKVRWQNHGTEEATWELEDSIRQQYLHLF